MARSSIRNFTWSTCRVCGHIANFWPCPECTRRQMKQQQAEEQTKQEPGVGTHATGCTCALCKEHRELSAIVTSAEQRKFYLNPVVTLRLAEIEREIGGQR